MLREEKISLGRPRTLFVKTDPACEPLCLDVMALWLARAAMVLVLRTADGPLMPQQGSFCVECRDSKILRSIRRQRRGRVAGVPGRGGVTIAQALEAAAGACTAARERKPVKHMRKQPEPDVPVLEELEDFLQEVLAGIAEVPAHALLAESGIPHAASDDSDELYGEPEDAALENLCLQAPVHYHVILGVSAGQEPGSLASLTSLPALAAHPLVSVSCTGAEGWAAMTEMILAMLARRHGAADALCAALKHYLAACRQETPPLIWRQRAVHPGQTEDLSGPDEPGVVPDAGPDAEDAEEETAQDAAFADEERRQGAFARKTSQTGAAHYLAARRRGH